MMWRGLRVALSAVLLGVAGCATTPAHEDSGGRYNQLFDEQLKVLFATQFPVNTAQEAMKKGDEAMRNGYTDLALFNYIRALELDANSYEALYKIGSIHEKRGNRRLAELAYRWTLKLSENHAGAWEGVGLMLLEKRQYDPAEKALRKAVQADPRRWRAHNALGVIADLKKKYQKADAYYRAALHVVPNSPRVLNNLGYSKYLAGDWNDAERLFEMALNYDPQYERAWMNLGLLHTRFGRYDKALRAFRRVMDEPSAYNNVGYVCMLDGNDKMAETFFRKAIQLSASYYPAANENLKRISTPERWQKAFSESEHRVVDGKLSLPESVNGKPGTPLILKATKKEQDGGSQIKDGAMQAQGSSEPSLTLPPSREVGAQ